MQLHVFYLKIQRFYTNIALYFAENKNEFCNQHEMHIRIFSEAVVSYIRVLKTDNHIICV